jgi:hypothetical protein
VLESPCLIARHARGVGLVSRLKNNFTVGSSANKRLSSPTSPAILYFAALFRDLISESWSYLKHCAQSIGSAEFSRAVEIPVGIPHQGTER